MAWTDNLRAASFRGVGFKVESHDAQGGRRAVTHEFALRDTPYTEDMGRRAREFSVDAYVIGDDYMQQRDALMRACDEEGSAELVHPYLGTLKVVCKGWSLRESKSEGRMARFALSFVESGEAEFPSDAADVQARAGSAADVAKEVVIGDFENIFSIDGLPDFAVSDAQSLLSDAAGQLGYLADAASGLVGTQNGFSGVVGSFVGSISSLMATPGDLARNLFGMVETVAGLFDSPRSAVYWLSRLFDFGSDTKPISTTTTTRRRQQQNRVAIFNLVQTAAVVESARQAANAEYDTADDAEGVRDSIAGELDAVMENPDTSDDAFMSLQALRTSTVNAVPPDDVALPNLVTLTPEATVPALVLAYDLYEDASRESEIVTRNSIRHPGFIPGAEPLRVKSNA